MGRGREWGGRASHTVFPWTWEPGGKGNCSFFEKVGLGPLDQRRNRNRRFSSRPSSGGSGAVLAVSWERANSNISGLPASGPLRRLPGRLGAWLGRGGRRSPARGSTHRPMCWFGLGRSSSGGRRRAPTAITWTHPPMLRSTSYLQMPHRMKCWAPRGTDQRNHPGTGRDVRCVSSKRSVGACPAERLLQ